MVNMELWLSEAQGILREGADFLSTMSDKSSFATGHIVHIPQANADAAPLLNQRASTPSYVDYGDITWVNDNYSTPTITVADLDAFQASFDLRSQVMGAKFAQMVEFAGDTILSRIAASPNVTTVTAGASVTYSDILAVKSAFDAQKVRQNNRSLILPSDMYNELLTDEVVARQYASGFGYSVVGEGKVLKVAGIDIYQRHTVATANAAPAGLAYQKECVGFAKTGIEFMVDSGDNGNGNPALGGVAIRAFMWLGARALRTNAEGVVILSR